MFLARVSIASGCAQSKGLRPPGPARPVRPAAVQLSPGNPRWTGCITRQRPAPLQQALSRRHPARLPLPPVVASHKQGPGEGFRKQQWALDVDDKLLTGLRPLIRAVCHEMEAHMESCKEAGSARVAAAALAAAEANGAFPPLSTAQRQALKGALAQAADELQARQSRDESTDVAPGSEQSDLGELGEEVLVSIKPLAKELYETLVNQRTHLSRGDHTASPQDSIKAGGEVGNISLQSATGRTSLEPPHGVPAEGGSERAEHEAERDFEALELGDPERGRTGRPAAQHSGAQAQRAQHAQQGDPLERSLLMDQSDAPAAGDGMQAMGDADSGAWRPIKEHYQRHEEATEGG